MDTQNKTVGKTTTDSVGVTETQKYLINKRLLEHIETTPKTQDTNKVIVEHQDLINPATAGYLKCKGCLRTFKTLNKDLCDNCIKDGIGL
jgi:hypothetical protein